MLAERALSVDQNQAPGVKLSDLKSDPYQCAITGKKKLL